MTDTPDEPTPQPTPSEPTPSEPTADEATANAWNEVGSSFQGLGLKLKYHFEQQRSAGEDPAPVQDALRKLAAAVDDALEAVGAAAKDPAVRDDARRVGDSLGAAFQSTFADVGDELRRLFTRRGGERPSE